MNLGVSDRELEVVREDEFEVVGGDVALVAFVEESEALAGLFDLAVLVPADGDGRADEFEVDLGALAEVRVDLAQLVVDLLLRHLVETEVVQDVPEVRDADVPRVLLVVEFERVLQI